jgi:phospholipid/cholesterol/gamma-HCH transport system ATP-binding protein
MPGETIIDLRHVTVSHAGHKLLDDVSLSVREGEIFGLVFSHGTGKSTLLRVAAGFFSPEHGEVLYRGRRISDFSFEEERSFQARTGFVFQNGGLLVNTKVFDNVALPLRYHTDTSEKEIEKKVMTALETVGMASFANRFPWELTIAKQKLVTLARSLVRDPELIYFDNFVTGTDVVAWQTMNRVVRQQRATRGIAWLLVLEADPETYQIADQLCIIEDGRVVDVAAPKKMRESKDVRVSRVFKTMDFGEFDAPAPGAEQATNG